MELRSLLPFVVVAIVAWVLLRVVLGAIKTSAKLMVWLVVAAAVFGLSYLWYQNQGGMSGIEDLPTLRIPQYNNTTR